MLSFVVIGVVLGATYGLIAVGLIFVFQTTQVLNFSFGAFGMVGCYAFATMSGWFNPWLALLVCGVLALVVGIGIGAITTQIQRVDVVSKSIATLALLSALSGLVLVVWGTDPRATPTLTSSLAFRIAHVGVTWQRVLVVVVDIVATIAIVSFFRRGRIGAALRAVADDSDIARLVGLPVRALWLAAWSASTTLAVVVMILLLPDLGLDVQSLSLVFLVPVSAVVVAGFRSLPIGFTVAFALGLAQSIFAGYSQLSQYEQVLPLVVIVVGLLAVRRGPAFERV